MPGSFFRARSLDHVVAAKYTMGSTIKTHTGRRTEKGILVPRNKERTLSTTVGPGILLGSVYFSDVVC